MPSDILFRDSNLPKLDENTPLKEQVKTLLAYMTGLKQDLRYTLNNLKKDNFNEAELKDISDDFINRVGESFATQDDVKEVYTAITQTTESIISQVFSSTVTPEELSDRLTVLESLITQTADEIELKFNSSITDVNGDITANKELIEEYIRFSGANIELGRSDSSYTAIFSNESLIFYQDGAAIMTLVNKRIEADEIYIKRISVGSDTLGRIVTKQRSGGSISRKWMA